MDDRQQERIARLRRTLSTADRVTVLTGAGASAESGVPVYRGNEGLYNAFTAEEVATQEAFDRDPEKVWAWYHERRAQLATVEPNAGHRALAELQRRFDAVSPGGFHLATQNIDGLHQAAGSRDVIEMHGNLWHTRCTACDHVDDTTGQLLTGVPRCSACGGRSRPHIVWFGEMLPSDVWLQALGAASSCEVFITVGTSAVVQPVASLVHVAADAGAMTVEINLEETPNTRHVEMSLLGTCGDVLPALVE